MQHQSTPSPPAASSASFAREKGREPKNAGRSAVARRADSGDGCVDRLYNPCAGDHHFTTSAYERDCLVALGWIAEVTCCQPRRA